MKVLSIDIETFSSANLKTGGVYKYSEAKDFTILLFGYSINGGEVKCVDLASGEKLPDEVLSALNDENVLKTAYNANFERVCLSRFLDLPYGTYLNPRSWHCTMVWAAYLGLPLSLKAAGAALGLEQQKLTTGEDLIKLFCLPQNKNGIKIVNDARYFPDEWTEFIKYNMRDVEVEVQIQKALEKYPVPEFVWKEYWLDQEINDRGILIDRVMMSQALQLAKLSASKIGQAMYQLTGLSNPNSVMQLKAWLKTQGLTIDSLNKKAVANSIEDNAPDHIKAVLKLRQASSMSSIKKYQAMQKGLCLDNRARGLFQFYGAQRTGRWSGRRIQLQNLRRNDMPDLDTARELVKKGEFETLEMLYDNIPEILSQLIRTAFIPKNGRFVVADFSAIEARVLAWLAGEAWRMKVFADGGDIYCASATEMFHVPVVKHGVNGHLRQKGKIAELALGYGGGVGALKSMGALELGLKEDELKPLVDLWRNANKNIVQYWWDIGDCVKNAIIKQTSFAAHGLTFEYAGNYLFIGLPSGRKLSYPNPKIEKDDQGFTNVTYSSEINGIWCRAQSYGPKFVENITQAIARDLLANAIANLAKYNIVMHVHDEVVIETDEPIEPICQLMAKMPDWANGLLLRADGYDCEFYRKD